MNNTRYSLLRKVFAEIPAGALVDSAWFARHNISNQSVYGYVQSGILAPLGRGIFRLIPNDYDPEEKIDWEVILASMDRVMNKKFHVGGLSAITLKGRHHFGTFGDPLIYVYGKKLPKWMTKLNTNGNFKFRTNYLFKSTSLGIEKYKSYELTLGPEVTYPVSTMERAILEMIDTITNYGVFEHVDLLFDGLYDADPDLLNSLLKDCRKFKVRRLFLIFAERHNHSWMSSIDKQNIELGTHSRQLIKDGKFHPEYKITVPEEYLVPEGEVSWLGMNVPHP